jgi:hypothetical protein
MTQNGTEAFSAADLGSNKAGHLTDDQRKRYRNLERSLRKDEFTFALLCAAIAAILLTATGPAPNAEYRPLAGAAFAALGVILLIRAVAWPDGLTRDLRSGKVETVEGAVGKHTFSGRTTTFHYLDLGGKHYEVGQAVYSATPEAGYVRLYILPRSHKVVNMERLPDKPLPEGFMAEPGQIMSTLATAFRSHDGVQAAEARAELAALGNAMRVDEIKNPAPPPAGQRDPRPLQQALIGTWKTGMMSIAFMPDGTIVATLPNGQKRQGHWSIGADGRLHSDAIGTGVNADAWVSGDTLTISEDGQGLAFNRAAGN